MRSAAAIVAGVGVALWVTLASAAVGGKCGLSISPSEVDGEPSKSHTALAEVDCSVGLAVCVTGPASCVPRGPMVLSGPGKRREELTPFAGQRCAFASVELPRCDQAWPVRASAMLESGERVRARHTARKCRVHVREQLFDDGSSGPQEQGDDRTRCVARVEACVTGHESCALPETFDVRAAGSESRRLEPSGGLRCVGLTLSTSARRSIIGGKVKARLRDGTRLRARLDVGCYDVPPVGDDVDACRGLALPIPTVGSRAHFPPSLPLEGVCGAEYSTTSNYTTPPGAIEKDRQRQELHIISVDRPTCPDDLCRVFDPIRVVVEPRDKPVVLALAANGSLTWDVVLAPGAEVTRVVTAGWGVSTVQGIPAERVSAMPRSHVGIQWELGSNASLVAAIRHETGLVEDSFQGCHDGRQFTIPYSADPPTTCAPSPVTGAESAPETTVVFPGCESIAAESGSCLTLNGGEVGLVGLDSGAYCPLTPAMSAPPAGYLGLVTGMAWLGEVLYVCGNEGLVRVDLRTGANEHLELPCETLADDEDGLLVQADSNSISSTLMRVTGYQALLTRDAKPIGIVSDDFVATLDGKLYSASTTDTVRVLDLTTGQRLHDVALDAADARIAGFDATPNGRLVVLSDGLEQLLMTFDAATGARLSTKSVSSLEGLACRTRGAP